MRKISLVLFAALLFVSGNVLANNPNPEAPTKALSTQIQKMLNRNSFGEAYEGAHAQVRFTFNKEGEIVVLSVDTENSNLEGFVKGKLNYKKVQAENITEGKMYTVSVRIAA
ncbi:MAG: hypothetical protein ED555_08520 [Allomuricauda sp.]|nr:MAG: hypothetical protein ED555_08520 [Allomuricauda sp.]